MVDARIEKELSQLAADLAMPVLTILTALLLLVSRKVGPKLFPNVRPSRRSTLLVAGACWAGVLALYVVVGNPGFANDGYLIIMQEQLDPAAVEPADLYAELVATAESSQADLRAELDRLELSYRPYYLVNMVRGKRHDTGDAGNSAPAGRGPGAAKPQRAPVSL